MMQFAGAGVRAQSAGTARLNNHAVYNFHFVSMSLLVTHLWKAWPACISIISSGISHG
jgi:hypothetical protein